MAKRQVNEFPKAPPRSEAGEFTEEAQAMVQEARLLPQMTEETSAEVQTILTDINNRLISERANVYRLRELLFGDGHKAD